MTFIIKGFWTIVFIFSVIGNNNKDDDNSKKKTLNDKNSKLKSFEYF